MTPKVVIERTYKATLEEMWSLWTTKEGFESWWGPEGFRSDVRALDARVGGPLLYDMVAATPETIAEMKKMGYAPSHETRGTFTEIQKHKRLAITHVIDFVKGTAPFEQTMVVEFFPKGDRVRMVVSFDAMPNDELGQMQNQGFTSQLTKLDRRFGKPA